MSGVVDNTDRNLCRFSEGNKEKAINKLKNCIPYMK